MDKNKSIAFIVMIVALMGWFFFTQPSSEELAKQRQHYADSISAVNKAIAERENLDKQKQAADDEAKKLASSDTAVANKMYGTYAAAFVGTEKNVVLENDLVKVQLSTKGGAAAKVALKNYKDYKGDSLILFDVKKSENYFNIEIPANGRVLNTADMFFTPTSQTDSSVTLTANIGSGTLSFVYTLPKNSYMLGYDIQTKGLRGILPSSKSMKLCWKGKVPQHEKSQKFESRYAELTYKMADESSVDYVSQNDDEDVEDPLRWVAFKDQYFSSVFITDSKNFANAALASQMQDPTSGYIQNYNANINLTLDPTVDQVSKFRFFYGPNLYKLLRSYDENLSGSDKLKMNRLVPLGWSIIRWVNQLIVIPLFNLLGNFVSNYGIIILLMTLILKLIIFPFTYKSYMSTAKMRVLKPEIDKELESIPEENQQERSMKTMEIYQRVGVSPMGGCFPMLLSMPFLFAMFYFFPTAIELRGQSFLWAEDLSAYDAIFTWEADIPVISSMLSNHISLFCLLMTVTNIVYTKINFSMQSAASTQQMPYMKYMMYLMPLMFFYIFNDYASGLSMYYFVSLLITILQTFGMRFFIDEDKLLVKIHEKAAKRATMSDSNKKSFFQRLQEQAQLQQEEQRKKMNRK